MRKLIVTITAVLVFVLNAAAQDRTISGKVTDDKGAPIEGVSIATADGKYGTQTDKDGNYKLTLPVSVKTLVFSSVNYETATLGLGKLLVLNASLVSVDKSLQEVVVVGYGTQQKKAFTGASSKVDTKEFAQLLTPSIDKQLAGRASGVNVNNSSGGVNTPARIRIRGLNSYSQNASPLFVIDGVPMITGNLAVIGNSNAIGDINPNDIESIDVLKDGSATAIYGSRAANGIVMITTKKGAKGKSVVTYDGTYGYSSPMNKFEVLNAQQFVQIANEKLVNAGNLPQARMDANGTNTDWQKNVFVNNAFTQTHTIGVQGGTDKSTFYMSFNYSDQNGIVRSNKNTAYRAKANIEHTANKWFKVGNLLTVSRQFDTDQNNTSNGLSGSVVAALRALPNVPIMNPAHPTGYNLLTGGNALGQGNNLRSIDDNYTNIAFVLDNNRYRSDKYRIIDVAFLEFTPAKGLKIRSQIAADYFNDNSTQILDPRHGDGFSSNGIIYQAQQNILQTNIQNYLTYTYSKKGHSVIFTGGHELQQIKSRFFAGQGLNISDFFYIKENIITNTAVTQQIEGNYAESALESYFARINYDYKNRYFIQGSIRSDGQSSLAPGKQYGTFPGVSVGWRPVVENFWKNNKFLNKYISDLKLKASYAVVGNQLGGFPYLSTYGSRPYGNIGGIAVAVVGNPDLQWEQSIKKDFGVELGLWKNRINIAFDIFQNDIDKQVLNVPTPISMGIPGNVIPQNIGKIQNKGIELSIDADVLRCKDFVWNVNANYSNIKNKIVSLYTLGNTPTTELYPTNYNINRVGEPIFALFGYRYAGVNSGNGNPVYYNAANQLVQRNISNGTYYFANSLSDPALGAQTSLGTADKVILGSSLPTYYGAFTNTFRYKNFALEAMFRYQGGNKIMNITRQEILLNQKFANNGTEILNRWTTPGQVTDVPKMWYNQENIINQNGEALSRFVEKGDFLRLQNVVLSYTVNPKNIQDLTKNALKSCRFFLQAQNVYVWTKYRGTDPEAYSEAGQDNSTSPQVRNISVGLSLGF